jgi:hypothetical protein
VTVSRNARAIARICALAAAGWTLLVVAVGAILAYLVPAPAGPLLGLLALVLGAAAVIPLGRIRPPQAQTTALDQGANAELRTVIRQVSAALGVREPVAVELSPDCDAWLEPRLDGPVLVIGAPFLWWLRVSELRGLLAPVMAGIEAADDPQVRRARRLVRRLDQAERQGCPPWPGRLLARLATACRTRAELMERAIGAEAAERARTVEPAGRVYAHEQAGLVAVGWDRLLNRLALPAWRRGHAPDTLNSALAAALTELADRDRVGLGLTDRLTERPSCDLLDDPGRVDRAASALAVQIYLGDRGTQPLPWSRYVRTIAEPVLRAEAAAAPEHPIVAKTCALLEFTPVPDGPARPDPARDRPREPVPDPARDGSAGGDLAVGLRACVQCGLVGLGHARWEIDWLDGVILRDRAGLTVPVDELVHALVDNSDLTPLRDWLSYANGLSRA